MHQLWLVITCNCIYHYIYILIYSKFISQTNQSACFRSHVFTWYVCRRFIFGSRNRGGIALLKSLTCEPWCRWLWLTQQSTSSDEENRCRNSWPDMDSLMLTAQLAILMAVFVLRHFLHCKWPNKQETRRLKRFFLKRVPSVDAGPKIPVWVWGCAVPWVSCPDHPLT